MREFDFIVIGAGIAGAGIAYNLAPHARVLLIEQEAFPGYHSTGRSAALFAEGYGGGPIRALTVASRAFFEAPPSGFADHPLVTPRGCLFVGRADQSEAYAEQWRNRPNDAIELDGMAARRLVPVLKEGHTAYAILEPGAMDIDVHSLHQGFLRGAKASGAELATAVEISEIDRDRNGWRMATPVGIFTAAVLVNAAGAWADRIADLARTRRIGLQPCRRTAAIIDPPADINVDGWPMVIDMAEEFYFKPDAGRLLVSPADETPVDPCDARAEELDIAIGIDRMQQAADIPVRRVVRSWAGLRSFVRDRIPVVGFDEKVANFFWLAGQGGYGIQTAPALSRIAAAIALGKEPPRDVSECGVDCAELSVNRL